MASKLDKMRSKANLPANSPLAAFISGDPIDASESEQQQSDGVGERYDSVENTSIETETRKIVTTSAVQNSTEQLGHDENTMRSTVEAIADGVAEDLEGIEFADDNDYNTDETTVPENMQKRESTSAAKRKGGRTKKSKLMEDDENVRVFFTTTSTINTFLTLAAQARGMSRADYIGEIIRKDFEKKADQHIIEVIQYIKHRN